MQAQLRILNDRGVALYRDYLDELRGGSERKPPRELLADPWCSARFPLDVSVERRVFQNKLAVAAYLNDVLRLMPHSQIERQMGLWSWLSLFYFDDVCPPNKYGRRAPGPHYRYILDLDFRRFNRHLLLGPYNAYKLHGENAALLLYGPIHQTNRFFIELTSRQALFTNRGVIDAATLLYYDPRTGRAKRGAGTTVRKPGALGRFVDVIQQLDLTHDLFSMKGPDVVALLPEEFAPWRKKAKEQRSFLRKLFRRTG
ncbi:MAG TPA: hypothetical protein PKJ59_11375 [Syntrophales bacterium]|jgi:hypothetical protein|nr:hypothetical protein [Syntrophaceae bacterium]NLX32676.1 hypothetical protein [Deltaproteobacteria bacterium]HNZ35800.1 hypothetical protein [Syntrophales bacterium]HOF73238.1 hypothetical protein [Syntrophales bacterium]HOR31992.1 hypothetical protein [Syntrophales bacterium]